MRVGYENQRNGFCPHEGGCRFRTAKSRLIYSALGEKFTIGWVLKPVIDFFEPPVKWVSFSSVGGSILYR